MDAGVPALPRDALVAESGSRVRSCGSAHLPMRAARQVDERACRLPDLPMHDRAERDEDRLPLVVHVAGCSMLPCVPCVAWRLAAAPAGPASII
jgi:hypothetical protein